MSNINDISASWMSNMEPERTIPAELTRQSIDPWSAITFEISTSPVVYAEDKVDLTDKVVKAYDKKYSK